MRVIYFYYDQERPLCLLMDYAKARKENLTPDEAKLLRNIATAMIGKYCKNREQGRRHQDAPALAYLRVIERSPRTVMDAVSN